MTPHSTPRLSRPPRLQRRARSGGFTLIELMISVAIVAVLAKVALPSFFAYIQRSKVPAALDGLSAHALRMEQRYQDSGNYGSTSCGASLPTAKYFTFSCVLTGSGQGFTTTATGSGTMSGYSYTINHQGTRTTTAHPYGANSSCWTTKGSTCDT